jgi:hypothetical protein
LSYHILSFAKCHYKWDTQFYWMCFTVTHMYHSVEITQKMSECVTKWNKALLSVAKCHKCITKYQRALPNVTKRDANGTDCHREC